MDEQKIKTRTASLYIPEFNQVLPPVTRLIKDDDCQSENIFILKESVRAFVYGLIMFAIIGIMWGGK